MADLLFCIFSPTYGLFMLHTALIGNGASKQKGGALPARIKAHEQDGMIYYPVLGYTYKGAYYEVRYHLGSRQKYAQGQQVPIRVLASRPGKPESEGRTSRPACLFSAFVGLACLAAGIWPALR